MPSAALGVCFRKERVLRFAQICTYTSSIYMYKNDVGGQRNGWFAKVDNVFLRLGGFAKVDNRFGYEKWLQGGSIGLVSLI